MDIYGGWRRGEFTGRTGCRTHHYYKKRSFSEEATLNPSNAGTTLAQSTRTQTFLKIIKTLSCWYSLDSSRWVLSDEYPFARVSVIFQIFWHYFVLAKLAIGSIRVKNTPLVSAWNYKLPQLSSAVIMDQVRYLLPILSPGLLKIIHTHICKWHGFNVSMLRLLSS